VGTGKEKEKREKIPGHKIVVPNMPFQPVLPFLVYRRQYMNPQ
jgi:hypothetical protein